MLRQNSTPVWILILIAMVTMVFMAYINIGTAESHPASVISEKNKTLAQKNAQLRKQLMTERKAYKAQIRSLRKIAGPILEPTPEGNRRLARAYFGDSYECAAEIINGETAGTWEEQIAYTPPGQPWRIGTQWFDTGLAYGLGQARPASKMLKYGADAATNPLTQLIWFEAYAKERYGSVCGASAHWTPARSW